MKLSTFVFGDTWNFLLQKPVMCSKECKLLENSHLTLLATTLYTTTNQLLAVSWTKHTLNKVYNITTTRVKRSYKTLKHSRWTTHQECFFRHGRHVSGLSLMHLTDKTKHHASAISVCTVANHIAHSLIPSPMVMSILFALHDRHPCRHVVTQTIR
jgi:hypothetical protein